MADTEDLFARTHRVLDAARPVWVRLAVVFDAYRPPDFRATTLRESAFGVDVSAVVPGQLLGWYRLSAGGPYWWGLVQFQVGSRNGHLHVDLTQLVPATALAPRTGDDPPIGSAPLPARPMITR